MKFFKWLKDEIIGNAGIILLSLTVAFFCVIVFNVLMGLSV